jgi:membrane-bound metal-dependent hydrolase YbcI (DUF457 family)
MGELMIGRAHMALGMCVALLIGYFWNKRGNKVHIPIYWFLLVGAIAANTPDTDFFFYYFLDNPDSGWAHRSYYTHSLFGIFLWPIVISLVFFTVHALVSKSKKAENWRIFYAATIWAYASHLFSDSNENYDIPLAWPFSKTQLHGWYTEDIYGVNILSRSVMCISLITIAGLLIHYYYKLKKEKLPTKKGWIVIALTVLVLIFWTRQTLIWFFF